MRGLAERVDDGAGLGIGHEEPAALEAAPRGDEEVHGETLHSEAAQEGGKAIKASAVKGGERGVGLDRHARLAQVRDARYCSLEAAGETDEAVMHPGVRALQAHLGREEAGGSERLGPGLGDKGAIRDEVDAESEAGGAKATRSSRSALSVGSPPVKEKKGIFASSLKRRMIRRAPSVSISFPWLGAEAGLPPRPSLAPSPHEA